jgi:hypothetical protein
MYLTAGWSSGLGSGLRNQRSRVQILVVSRGFVTYNMHNTEGKHLSISIAPERSRGGSLVSFLYITGSYLALFNNIYVCNKVLKTERLN